MKHKKNNQILFPFVSTSLGGSFVSTSVLAEYLKNNEDWDFRILLPKKGDNATVFLNKGIDVFFYGLSDKDIYRIRHSKGYLGKIRALPTYFKIYKKAISYIKKEMPNIVHINDDNTILTWGIAAKRLNIPVVWHIRQEEGNKLLDRLRLKLASYIIFVAKSNKNRFKNIKTLPPNSVIHNSINTNEFFPGNKKTFRKKIEVDENKLTVGFIGNLISRKRPEWFVEAGAQCIQSGVLSNFVIVGKDASEDGCYLRKLKKMIRDYDVNKSFKFLGLRKDIPEVLRAFDILVVTSKSESFGRVIIEAMATGVPVVGVNVGGIPEIIQDGVTGFLVNSEKIDDLIDKLKIIICNNKLRSNMSKNGIKYIKNNFQMDYLNQKIIEECYEFILKKDDFCLEET